VLDPIPCRQRPEVKDVELVCIPRQVPGGLFGDSHEVDPAFCAAVNQWPKVKGQPGGRYTQRILPASHIPGGIILDLFIATPDNWGWQLCLRTGSAGFNQHVLLRAVRQQGYVAENGYLQRRGEVIATPEESDIFRVLRLPWCEPWAREV
jgi:DNA polymerase/3'-5' exonuclease PolX